MIKLSGIKGVLAISLICSITLAATGCAKKDVVAPEAAKNVKVISVSTSSIETDITYGGEVAPVSKIGVSSKVAGNVESVRVSIGQAVKKGDVLFTVGTRELQAQYNQTKGALDTAKASFIKTSDSGYLQQLIPAKSSVDTAQNSYNDAQTNYNMVKQQYNIGDYSKEELDAAKSKLDSTASQLSAANNSLELLKSKIGPQSNAAIAGQVEQAEGALDLAQIQIDNSTITSPIDGIVSVRNVEVGQMVSSSIIAFTIIDTSCLLAQVNMTDKGVVKVKISQKIPLQITSMNNKIVEGIVDTISPSADTTTNLYTVKLRIANKDNSLKTGMILKANFPDEIKNNIPVVPNSAIFTENSVQYVYAVESNKLKKTEVVVGITNNKQIEIKSGIKLGDSVVIEGQSFLNDGQKVKITK